MIERFRSATLFAVTFAAVGMIACSDDDPVEPTELAAPTATAAAQSPTSIAVSWNAVTGATGYIVERAEGATGGTFAQVGTPTGTSHTDTGLTPNTTYRYRVAATAGAERSDFSGDASAATPPEGSQCPCAATISADITANRTLTADTVYTLQGFIKVANGATLTIEAGTRIVGDFETLGSSLFILRGARIRALGTAQDPVVFTSERPAGQRQPGDWGGLVLIGNGIINRTHPVVLEGTENFPEPLTYSGGTDNADNSGELHYVRVEFAGYATATNAELNSFTFAAIGSGTQLDHLESLSGLDDSFEWFGGAVDGKYLVSYESGDDHFDMSEGYQGRLQYLIAYQSRVLEPRAGAGNVSNDPQGIENDGCEGASCPNGRASTPHNIPMVANFTLLGTGPGVLPGTTAGGTGMLLRRGTGGYYVNGVVARWPTAAIGLRDQADTEPRVTDDELAVRNILEVANGTTFEGGTGRFTVNAATNAIVTGAGDAAALFTALPATPTQGSDFDWTPAGGSAAASGGLEFFAGALETKAGTFITGTTFRGAAPPTGATDANWWVGWTNYAAN
jgi:hypothetical protein